MKLTPEQLASHLDKTLARIYVLSGDEPLQLMEAADAIREAAKRAGYVDRVVFHADTGFDWGRLQEASTSFSLFGESRLLDLRLQGKPDKSGSAALIRYSESPPNDAILLLTLPRLTASEQKVKWFQALEPRGVFMQFWPLENDKLLRWLDQRLNRHGLLADESGLRLLAARVEGNLLAAAQEIEKLHILYDHGQLTNEQILQSVADSARYDVFDLSEPVLCGQIGKIFRVLSGLKEEGIAAPVVLWALTRELRLINTLMTDIASGAPPETVFSRHRLFDSRKTAMAQALRRLNRGHVHTALVLARQADRIMKGMSTGDEWDALLSVCEHIAAPMPSSTKALYHYPTIT